MEKKNLKWYEAPAMELVDVKLQGMICTSPDLNGGAENMGGEGMYGEEE